MPSESELLLLDRDQVAALLCPEAVLDAVREAFVLHARRAGRVFPLVREALADGIFGIKAGLVAEQDLLGLKAAGFWAGNRQRGGEAHQATILLIDPASGRPRCLIDGNAVTTERTGAAGALGLMHLARPDSTRLTVFGTGVQAGVQLRYALRVLPGLTTIRYVSIDGQRDARFERAAADALGPRRLTLATDRNAAVADSDIVITATPGGGPLFDAAALQPGTHLNCVGADTRGKRELPEGVLGRPDLRLFVDDVAQARAIGETQWAPATPFAELGDLLAGGAPFARQAGDVTLFDMTGLALQDLTVARLLQTQALQRGLGTHLPWPWLD